jgi:hypothetical protein
VGEDSMPFDSMASGPDAGQRCRIHRDGMLTPYRAKPSSNCSPAPVVSQPSASTLLDLVSAISARRKNGAPVLLSGSGLVHAHRHGYTSNCARSAGIRQPVTNTRRVRRSHAILSSLLKVLRYRDNISILSTLAVGPCASSSRQGKTCYLGIGEVRKRRHRETVRIQCP